MLGVLLHVSLPYFFKSGSLTDESMQYGIGWPLTEYLGSTWLYAPVLGLQAWIVRPKISHRWWGFELSSSHLFSKHSYLNSHFHCILSVILFTNVDCIRGTLYTFMKIFLYNYLLFSSAPFIFTTLVFSLLSSLSGIPFLPLSILIGKESRENEEEKGEVMVEQSCSSCAFYIQIVWTHINS